MGDTAGFYGLHKRDASTIDSINGGADSTTSCGVSADWKRYSGALSEWAWSRLVNRHDAWGGYRKLSNGSIKTYTDKRPVTKPALVDHFRGVLVRGLHSISLEGTCKWLGLDIDAHGQKTEEQIAVNEAFAVERFNYLRAAGFNPLLESNKRGGYHLWLFFSKTITSEAAYRVSSALQSTWPGDEKELPEQRPDRADRNTDKGFGGSGLRIPGRHHTRDEWAKVFDGSTWLEGAAACRYILSLNGDDPERLPAEWTTFRSKKELEDEKRKLEAEAREIERKRQRRIARQPEITTNDRYAKAEEILDRHKPAVQGDNGSKVAFRLACLLVQGCELSPSEAAAMMLRSSWNSACVPSWPEHELLHKCDGASKAGGDRGYMLRHYDSTSHKWCEPLTIVPALVHDDGETISLEEYWKKLEDVLEGGDTPGVRLLRSAPGTGKTFALRQFVKQSSERALVLLPVHANLAEEQKNYSTEMTDRTVAATPKRQTPKDGNPDDPSANCWNGLADHAEALGLPAVACVCNGCPLRAKCEASGYLHSLNTAKAADVLLATHKRGEVQGLQQLAEGRSLVIIDEDSRQLLKPLEKTRLEDVKRALTDLRQALEDPKTLNSAWLNASKDDGDSAITKKAELEAFLRWSEPVLSDLVKQLEGATSGEKLVLSKWDGGEVPKKLLPFVFNVLSERSKLKNKSPWPALARALTGGESYVADHQRWKIGADGSKITERLLVSVRSNHLPDNASIWIADGTARKDDLEKWLGGQTVEDVTPRGRLKRLKRAVQYGRDISRETSSEKVISHLRGFLAAHPEIEKLGVICHQPHFAAIEEFKKQEPRIKRTTYFGNGSERMSNDWKDQCDALLVLGTPRPGPEAVRLELLRSGFLAAASIVEPPWTKVIFETINERGESEFNEGGQYDHPDWRAAFNGLCQTELVQCIGRARAETPDGIPVYVFSTEPCGLPMAADGLPEGVHSTDDLVLKVLTNEARPESLFHLKNDYLARNNETPQAPIPFRTLHKLVQASLEAGGRPGGLTVNGLRSCLQRLEKRGQITRHGHRGYLPVVSSKPEPAKAVESPPTSTTVSLHRISLDQPEVAYSTTVTEETTAPNALGSTRRHRDDQRDGQQTSSPLMSSSKACGGGH